MSNSNYYYLKDASLWGPNGVVSGQHLLVKDGVLLKQESSSFNEPADAKVLNCESLVLLPAGVDPQVHLRVPGQEQKETAKSAMKAALKGGFGCILNMPNTNPVLDKPEVLELARKQCSPWESEYGVRVLFSSAISLEMKGKKAAPYEAMAKEGISAFTDDGLGVVSDELMEMVFAASEKTGLPVLQHAEFPGHGCALAAGPVQEKLGTKAYPAEAEWQMVERDLRLLKKYPGARYHVLHVSSAKTLDLVDRAKQEGLRVTCEVSPHHLFFSSDDIVESNASFKMNPPLRSKEDRLALVKGLASGLVDFVATDHAPHETSVKQKLTTAAFGTIGLETSLRVLLTLEFQGQLSKDRVVEVFSSKPAEFLGVAERFGEVTVGRPFNALLVQTNSEEVVSEKDFGGKSVNSCFLGTNLRGCIEWVFLESKVFESSKIQREV